MWKDGELVLFDNQSGDPMLNPPIRILYVLSEDDLADAYDQARDPDLDPGDGEHTAYYELPPAQRDTLFYAARKAIEWTSFAAGEWNETLVDSVRDTLKGGA